MATAAYPRPLNYAKSDIMISMIEDIQKHGLKTAAEAYVYFTKTVEGKRFQKDLVTRLCELHQLEKQQAQLLWSKIIEEKLFAIALLAEIAAETKEQLKAYQAEDVYYYHNKLHEESLQHQDRIKQEAIDKAQELEKTLLCALDVIHSQIMQYHDDILNPVIKKYDALVERTEKENTSLKAYDDAIDSTFSDLNTVDDGYTDSMVNLKNQQQILQEQIKVEGSYQNSSLPGYARFNSSTSFRLSLVSQLLSMVENDNKQLISHQGQLYFIHKDQDITTLSEEKKHEALFTPEKLRNSPKQYGAEALEQLAVSRAQVMASRKKDLTAIDKEMKQTQLMGDMLKIQSFGLGAQIAPTIPSPRILKKQQTLHELDAIVSERNNVLSSQMSRVQQWISELGLPDPLVYATQSMR